MAHQSLYDDHLRNAIAPADDVLIVTNPEISAVRDADRIIGLLEANHKGPGKIILSGVIGIVGYALILVAFTIERVSYIVSLRQTSVVFAVLMGSYFLKEKHGGIRLAGAVIIFVGGFLISLAK